MVPRMKNVTERRFSTGLWMADSTSILEAAIKRHGEKRAMDRLNATEPIVPQRLTSDYRFMAIINFPTFDPVSKLSERGRWCSGCMGIDGLMKIAQGLSCTYAAKASRSAIETAVTISGQVNTYRIYAYRERGFPPRKPGFSPRVKL